MTQKHRWEAWQRGSGRFALANEKNGTLYWYINGIQNTSTINIKISAEEAPILILDTRIRGGAYYGGYLDDIRIYNRTLSATEIQLMYAGGK